jgi:hypothetical protein
MQWQGDIEQFVVSFLGAPPDQSPLQQALTSIPQDRWWAVWGRIIVGLDSEMVRRLPEVGNIARLATVASVVSHEDDEVLAMIELKESLLHQEGHRRLGKQNN